MNHYSERIKQILVAFVLMVAVAGLSSCEKNSYPVPSVDPTTKLFFQTDIQPIFTSNCITCHGGTKSPDLREGKSFLALTKGGYVSNPGESSKLYLKMTGDSHSPKSTSSDKLKVLYWITQGALNN